MYISYCKVFFYVVYTKNINENVAYIKKKYDVCNIKCA
jgi:hypothetical protein